jgi:protein SCO1/2
VNRSYRLGIQIVVGTILIAGCAIVALHREPEAAARAGQEIPSGTFPVGDFQLIERSGRHIDQTSLEGRVWIAAFVFTRCPLSCPRISGVMKGLQGRLARTNVQLVSISVDPDNDTPAVLTEYAARFEASPDRWWFLTGPKPSIHDLVQSRFKLGLMESTPAERAAGSETIIHSDRLALVDRGQIVGFFDSTDSNSLDALVARASRLSLPHWIRLLPAVNAGLNSLCAAFLLAGWSFIRRRQVVSGKASTLHDLPPPRMALVDQPNVRAHATCMLLAVITSAAFLTTYLVYHSQAGSVSFPHRGSLQKIYLTILTSHTMLAVVVVPLVIVTLIRALRRDFPRHLRIAQLTFPIWLYVSITGVVIYLLLYHLPAPASGG